MRVPLQTFGSLIQSKVLSGEMGKTGRWEKKEEEGHQGDLGAQLRVQTRYLSLPGEMGSISISSTLGDVEFEEVEAVGDVAAEAAKEEG